MVVCDYIKTMMMITGPRNVLNTPLLKGPVNNARNKFHSSQNRIMVWEENGEFQKDFFKSINNSESSFSPGDMEFTFTPQPMTNWG